MSVNKRVSQDKGAHQRISSRPRVVRDYQALNDPMPELSDNGEDDLPELLQNLDEDEPEERPIEEAEPNNAKRGTRLTRMVGVRF